jgi:VWFA-related protein
MSTRSTWLRLATAFLLGLAFLTQAGGAAGQGTHTVDVVSLDDGQFPTLTAIVNVLDPAGKPVANLTEENFAASFDDATYPIESVTTAVDSEIGVAVVLVVDTSGSMAGEPMARAKEAARAFVEGLSPNDTVTVVSFSDDVSVLQDFTADKEAVFAALDGLEAKGDTVLYQAAAMSAGLASQASSQRRAVVLLSDGVDHGARSTFSRDESLAWVKAIGVPFFSVGLGSDIDREYLSALSESSGGQFRETPTPQGLSQLYEEIGNFLRSQYIVSVNAEGVDETQELAFRLDFVALGQVLGSAVETLPPHRVVPPVLEPPQVSIAGLVSGQEVSEPLTITVTAAGERPITAVSFLVDGNTILQDSEAPFQMQIDPKAFAEGNRILRIEATDSGGATGATEASFVVAFPSTGGGLSPAVVLVPIVLLVAILIGALVFARSRRMSRSAPRIQERVDSLSSPVRRDGEPQEWSGASGEPEQVEDEPLGKITVVSGPQAGETFPIGKRPRRIGSARYCDIVLRDEEEVTSAERARVWVSDDRLMFHQLTSLGAMAFEGESGGWFVYESGDEFQIGSHGLKFELLRPPEETTSPPPDEQSSTPSTEEPSPPAAEEQAPTPSA